MSERPPFWKTKSLEEMTREEWESLCDGCAKCCLVKLEDEDTGQVYTTDVACKLLDHDTCRCTRYAERSRLVPTCHTLTPEKVAELDWMPSTCAYRLVREGKDLPDWHPLVTGVASSTIDAGMSVRGRIVSELEIEEDALEFRLVDWAD